MWMCRTLGARRRNTERSNRRDLPDREEAGGNLALADCQRQAGFLALTCSHGGCRQRRLDD